MLSQIPRALGLPPLLKIDDNRWLIRNHLYLQFVLLFLGLSVRLLLVNSDHRALGIFLLLTIISAIAFVWLYGGRAWCHYGCPFGPVQAILTGPRGFLGSEPLKTSLDTVPNSGCRTFDKTLGKDRFDCMGCKAPCRDQNTGRVNPSDCLKEFKSMQRKLSLSSDDHNKALKQLEREKPHLFAPLHQQNPIGDGRTIRNRKPDSDRTFR